MKIQTAITLICTSLAVFFSAVQPQKATAQQIDTIRLKDKRLNTATLKPGVRQYLVTMQSQSKPKSLYNWFWVRDTRTEQRNGEKVFVTTQHWYGSDTTAYRAVYSVNRASDFAPIYHRELAGGKTVASNWTPTRITAADSVAANVKKDMSIALTEPAFNWNLDIETFEMLPLAAGKAFAINFIDVNGMTEPKYAVYKVSGSEVLNTLDNQKVDCWKLVYESDHAGRHYVQAFWISKKGKEMLKEEDSMPGGYRYKIKMPAAMPNVAERFTAK